MHLFVHVVCITMHLFCICMHTNVFKKRTFKVNNSLKNQYKKLFNKIDRLVYLKAPHFGNIFKWRLLQEQKMKLTSKNKKTMSKSKVREFIMFYERITLQMIKDLSKSASMVMLLRKNHEVKKLIFNL